MEPGTQIGPYEIIEPLGKGGMGEVYRARDSRLGREVAIKVLPERFSEDPERLGRFEQEARAAAALNHPHIAVVHDVGESDGTHFMVQEYLEGESLRERLDRGALSLEASIELAIEVAEALVAAHRAGIVHRDLKPANVFVTPDEHAKVLDFGLAKLLEPASPRVSSGSEESPTALATSAGMVMGTAGYMAPEQIDGRPVDGRSDIFALGCLLYELVSGRQPFAGDSLHETLHKIGHAEPTALRKLDTRLPAELQRIVSKCLRKEPGRRYQHADDLAVDLRQLALSIAGGTAAADSEPAPIGGTGRASRSFGWPALLGVGTLALLAGLGGLYLGGLQDARPGDRSPPAVSVSLQLPGLLNGSGTSNLPIAISPQGDKVVFVIQQGGSTQLFLRPLDRRETVPIPGTEGGSNPFWAPDGETVAFFSGNSILRVSVRDADFGVPVRVTGVEGAHYGATWAEDDTIYFATNSMTTPMAVPASGGVAAPVDVVDPGLDRYAAPWALPGGNRLLVTVRERDDEGAVLNSIAWLSLENGQLKVLGEGSGALYLRPGYLVWAIREPERRSNVPIVAARFDPERGELLTPPVPLSFGLLLSLGDGRPRMAASDSGLLLYDDRQLTRRATLAWVDRSGRVTGTAGEPGAFASPRLSPDGTRVALASPEFNSIRVLDLERDGMTEIPVEGGTEGFPAWSADGSALYILATAQRGLRIFRGPADGSRRFEQLLPSETTLAPMSVGPDGTLFYYEVTPAGERDLWFLPPAGEPVRFLSTEADERAPMVSPDGRHLAYVSNGDGRDQVYVRPWPEGERRYKISTTGGAEPVWRSDGSELFYREGNRMYAVSIRSDGDGFVPGRPELLFEAPFALSQFGNPNYDVSDDGDRFLMVSEPFGDSAQEIDMVVNWFEELERLLPSP